MLRISASLAAAALLVLAAAIGGAQTGPETEPPAPPGAASTPDGALDAAPPTPPDPEAAPQNDAPQVVREGDFTPERLAALILAVDPEAQALQPGRIWRFQVEGVAALVITDPGANRMRIVVRVRDLDGIAPAELARMLSANFDTALDARYALARGAIWSTFIHPLSELHDQQFLSGLGQTVNLALSYGSSYASGGMSFSGGDKGDAARRELIKRLKKRGQDI